MLLNSFCISLNSKYSCVNMRASVGIPITSQYARTHIQLRVRREVNSKHCIFLWSQVWSRAIANHYISLLRPDGELYLLHQCVFSCIVLNVTCVPFSLLFFCLICSFPLCALLSLFYYLTQICCGLFNYLVESFL